MYLWNTSQLAKEIATGQLSSEAKFLYLIYLNSLYAISAYLVYYFAVASSGFTYWFEALTVLVITIGGTFKCKEALASAKEHSLIESFIILSLPLSIKMLIFTGIALSIIPWGVEYFVASQFLVNSSYIETLVFILNIIYSKHSIVIILITTSWFYWRMAFHLSYIATYTPNQHN